MLCTPLGQVNPVVEGMSYVDELGAQPMRLGGWICLSPLQLLPGIESRGTGFFEFLTPKQVIPHKTLLDQVISSRYWRTRWKRLVGVLKQTIP